MEHIDNIYNRNNKKHTQHMLDALLGDVQPTLLERLAVGAAITVAMFIGFVVVPLLSYNIAIERIVYGF